MTDRSLVKRYFPDGAIPEDFEKWVKAQGLRRHPGSRQAAFAEWVYKKANLENPYRMTWGKVKEKARRAAKEAKYSDKQDWVSEPKKEELQEEHHFWNKLQICKCTVLICSTSPYCPHRATFTTFGPAATLTAKIWAKNLFASAKSQSYFKSVQTILFSKVNDPDKW